MKRLFFAFGILLCTEIVRAQSAKSIALNVYGGYVFQDRVELDAFTSYARDGFQYGAGLEYFIHETKSVELTYLRQGTTFPLYGPAGEQLNKDRDQGSITYILIGGNNYFGNNPQSKFVPYSGFGLGVGILNLEDGGNAVNFGWDIKLGVKMKTSPKISFKAQVAFQSVLAGFGSDLYVTSAGNPISIAEQVGLYQLGLSGGISYTF